jgi:quercetin dioxygenase-like cupin family protein
MPDQNIGAGTPSSCEPRSAADALSAQQKERLLAEPCRCFDLSKEIESLHQDIGWRRDGHSARTLVKHEDLRVVLIALRKGARMGEHKTDARVTIQTVAGSVRLWLGERAIALPLGGLLVLDRALPHDVEALEESGILLTVAWPG